MGILKACGLRKIYGSGETAVHALDGVDLTVEKGEFVAIVGTSGSGKSTLLHMLGGLDRPTEGKVFVDGKDIFALKDEELTIFRRRKIGFVFQAYNLVPVLNVYENIVLPIELDGGRIDRKFIDSITETLGLQQRLDALPGQLSGGMLQRAAAALLMALHPKYILADEPTSALDAENRTLLLELLEKQRETAGILFISHDVAALRTLCGTVHVMEHGMLTEQGTIQELLEHPKQAWTKEYAAANHPVSREGWTWTD